MAQNKKGKTQEKNKSHRGGGKKELTFACFVIMPDGRTVPVEELTPEENAQWQENMRRRLSENLSDFYTQHPELYKNVPEC